RRARGDHRPATGVRGGGRAGNPRSVRRREGVLKGLGMTALHDSTDPTTSTAIDLTALGTAGPDAVRAALDRAVEALFAAQSEQGWWKGELETNVTMDAEDLFLREFLGISDERVTRAAANWIRSQQRDDGTWATFFGGP